MHITDGCAIVCKVIGTCDNLWYYDNIIAKDRPEKRTKFLSVVKKNQSFATFSVNVSYTVIGSSSQ
jgi:hypothetical protein